MSYFKNCQINGRNYNVKAHNKWYSVDMNNGCGINNRIEFATYEQAFEYFEKVSLDYNNIELLEWEMSCRTLNISQNNIYE